MSQRKSARNPSGFPRAPILSLLLSITLAISGCMINTTFLNEEDQKHHERYAAQLNPKLPTSGVAPSPNSTPNPSMRNNSHNIETTGNLPDGRTRILKLRPRHRMLTDKIDEHDPTPPQQTQPEEEPYDPRTGKWWIRHDNDNDSLSTQYSTPSEFGTPLPGVGSGRLWVSPEFRDFALGVRKSVPNAKETLEYAYDEDDDEEWWLDSAFRDLADAYDGGEEQSYLLFSDEPDDWWLHQDFLSFSDYTETGRGVELTKPDLLHPELPERMRNSQIRKPPPDTERLDKAIEKMSPEEKGELTAQMADILSGLNRPQALRNETKKPVANAQQVKKGEVNRPVALVRITKGEIHRPIARVQIRKAELRRPVAKVEIRAMKYQRPIANVQIRKGEAQRPVANAEIRKVEIRRPVAKAEIRKTEVRHPVAAAEIRYIHEDESEQTESEQE